MGFLHDCKDTRSSTKTVQIRQEEQFVQLEVRTWKQMLHKQVI